MFQLLMLGVIGLKQVYAASVLMLPLPVITALFYLVILQHYIRPSANLALSGAHGLEDPAPNFIQVLILAVFVGDRQSDSDRDIGKQLTSDRQTDRQTDRRTDGQTDRQRHRQTIEFRQTDRRTERQTVRQRHRQTIEFRQTDGQTGRQTDRQTERQTYSTGRRTDHGRCLYS